MQLIISDNRPHRINFSKMKVAIRRNEKATLIASITFNKHYIWRELINNCFKIVRIYTFQFLVCLNEIAALNRKRMEETLEGGRGPPRAVAPLERESMS
jgi:hypothetical protein